MSETPFYLNDEIHGRCLELGGDGSYESCQRLLSELQEDLVHMAKFALERELQFTGLEIR